MRNLFLTVVFLICSGAVNADCNEFALHGDWTVFYRDNAFPTSVLAPDENISIRYEAKRKLYSVELTDKAWKAWSTTWSHECIEGQTVLFGAIERRNGRAVMLVEVTRVNEINELLPRQSGKTNLNQIVLHFPDLHTGNIPPELRDALLKDAFLVSHPGQAHGDSN